MEESDQESCTRVSIPLTRIKETTVKKILKRYKKIRKAEKRKLSREPTSSVNEDDAKLLLNLSKNMSNTINNISEEPPEKSSEMDKTDVIDLDELNEEKYSATVNYKLNTPEPAITMGGEQKTTTEIKSNENKVGEKSAQCQTDDIYMVSKDDYDLIKAKSVIRPNLPRLREPETQPERSIINRPVEDVNNNSEDRSNLEIPFIDLCLDENEFHLDAEISNKLISHSEQYKAMFAKVLELHRNQDKPGKSDTISVKHSIVSVNVSTIIQEIFANARHLEQSENVSVILNFDKDIQTSFDIMQNSKESNINNEDKCEKEVNTIKNNIETEQIESSEVSQFSRNKTVPISPVPGSLPNETLNPQQLLQQYKHQHSANYNGDSYPNTRMMSALELPEHRQRVINHWNSFNGGNGAGAEGHQQCFMHNVATANSQAALPASAFIPHITGAQTSMLAQQQRAMQNLAASNAALSAAAFTPQQSSSSNTNASIAQQQLAMHNVAAKFNPQQYSGAQASIISQHQHGMQKPASNDAAFISQQSLRSNHEVSMITQPQHVIQNMPVAGSFASQQSSSSVTQQQRVIQNEAASPPLASLPAATFIPQQSSGSFTRQQACQAMSSNENILQRPRKVKSTIMRQRPYPATGPRFPTSMQSKKELTQQKWRSLYEQQKAWESQLQNYPNTAWGQPYNVNFS